LTSLGLPHPVSNLAMRSDTLYILMMGHFVPSDEPAGQLVKAIKDDKSNYAGYQQVLSRLKRPVDVAYADLDADGDDEIVVCEFGNHTGSVALFTREAGKKYVRSTLFDAPGAVKVEIQDVDHDGRKDIIVLMAQGNEGIDIYFNKGNGGFERERVVRFPAVYGSASFCLEDMNSDGYMDIVYVNGDNADASRVLKPYHGIRVFLNDQHNAFRESYFYPLPGAYEAIVSDFDGDGDKDIAAISFFPDLVHYQDRGFVYLENISKKDNLVFAPSMIGDAARGRWITMVGGDFDRDNRDDIMLGSFTSMAIEGDTLNKVRSRYFQESIPILFLKNEMARKR